jgi:FkbM family methyltransferase
MRLVGVVLTDFWGLLRICGVRVAFSWLLAIASHSRRILAAANLLPADKALGPGPFPIRYPTARETFSIACSGAISGVREIYVRDCYLRGGSLAIRPGDTVLDLGANVGVFTNLALAHGARVVAVEPNSVFNAALVASVGLNLGYAERLCLIRAFVGEAGDMQRMLIAERETYRDAPWLSESRLIEIGALGRVDFLKCDIEGSEFTLFDADSRLLKMTRSLAVEVHSFAGDVERFVDMIRAAGFSIVYRADAADRSCVLLASRV